MIRFYPIPVNITQLDRIWVYSTPTQTIAFEVAGYSSPEKITEAFYKAHPDYAIDDPQVCFLPFTDWFLNEARPIFKQRFNQNKLTDNEVITDKPPEPKLISRRCMPVRRKNS